MEAIREPIIKKLLLVENQCFPISKQKSIDIRILFQPCDCPDFQVEFELHQGKHIDRYFTLWAIPLPELIHRCPACLLAEKGGFEMARR
jgi:hypothetical protein